MLSFRSFLFRILDPSATRRHKFSFFFEFLILGLILVNCIIISLETVIGIDEELRDDFMVFEQLITWVFAVEYLLRIFIAPERYSKQLNPWQARFQYMFTWSAIIDLVAIVPLFFFYAHTGIFRILRIIRIMRVLKAVRYMRALRDFGQILTQKREELLISFTFLIFLLFIVSTLMYFVEHEAQPDDFGSIPKSMWYGVATLTTVGYGDVYPITPIGRVLGGLSAILGVALFSLPAGIIAGGFAENAGKKRFKEGKLAQAHNHKLYKYCPHCGEKLN